MADETLQHDTTLATPAAAPASPRVTETQYPETQYPEGQPRDGQYTDGQSTDRPFAGSQFTDREVAELRRRLDDESGDHGGSRFGWFLIGFFAALLSITVAALVFLAVSDTDDDGNINLDVPSVNVEG